MKFMEGGCSRLCLIENPSHVDSSLTEHTDRKHPSHANIP